MDIAWEKAVDKIRAATEDGKLPRKVRDLLADELDSESIQALVDEIRGGAEELQEQTEALEQQAAEIEEAASSVESFQEAVGGALDAVEEYEGAEDRETKQHARESLLDALGAIVETYDALPEDMADLEVDDAEADELPALCLETVRVDRDFSVQLNVDGHLFIFYRGDDPGRADAVHRRVLRALQTSA